jgi:lipopolysaccharide biosynthesis protein
MTRQSLIFRRAYRLRPLEPRAGDHVARLRIDGPRARANLLLPYSTSLGYFAVPAAGSLTIDAPDFDVERLGAVASLWARLRLALLFKPKKRLAFEDVSVFSTGPKRERKRFTTFNQHMATLGVPLDWDLFARHPELVNGWTEENPPARALGPAPRRIAIVVHAYYEETWGDLSGALRRIDLSYDLIVTTVAGRERLIARIKREFPEADVEVMENRGRDVRPFLKLLERGRLDRYDAVCKIHGKRSADGGGKAYLGSLWRRRALFDLIAAPGLAQSIADAFARDPTLGMVGPRAFRYPNAALPEASAWSVNKDEALRLAEGMGVPADRFRLDFFGGTMFWVRPEALAPLRALKLGDAFPEERGLDDGGLEHVVERLFGTAVLAAGYRLEGSDGAEAQTPLGAERA